MGQPRVLAPGAIEGIRSGIYHCLSRVVEKRKAFGDEEKEQFVRFMRFYEDFCGVRVMAFCVMSNHFHILLEVPLAPEEVMGEKEFFRRMGLIKTEAEVEELRGQYLERKRVSAEEAEEFIEERTLKRMWSLSEYMKALKQRFTQWFNKRHEREGTLWECKFRSVIVEDGYAARVMAAYIDLNPLRAGMVKRPEEYRWCSYAEALAGKKAARAGVERVMSEYEEFGGGFREEKSWRQVIAEYRVILFTDGEERFRENEGTGHLEKARRGVSAAEAEKVRDREGLLSRSEMLRHRMRHFSEGMAIGSKAFLEEIFEANRERFGPKRTTGTRKIRGCASSLCALRDLR